MSATAEITSDSATNTVTLTIDGRRVEAPEGTSVLDAAKQAGIDIPTMCHDERLAAYGACRLCVVELVRGKRSRIVASCLYPVEEGLEVLTESERVVRNRRTLLELMLARWPWVDKRLLERYGVQGTRFDQGATFCILCGLCVRYCAEVKKENVQGFVGRGIQRQVVIYPELAQKACPQCGGGEMECLKVCPTGVIFNDMVGAVPGLGGKQPVAQPVRLSDVENTKLVADLLGDREPKRKK